jgi:ABC-type nitrate/sulfonate/bicarbonate transport system permease component
MTIKKANMTASPAIQHRLLLPLHHFKQMVTSYAPTLLLAIGLLVGWEIVVRSLEIPDWLLPPPSQIARTAVHDLPVLQHHTTTTLLTTTLGTTLALVVGFTLALLLDTSPLIRRAIYPLLVASQTMPIVAIAPLLVVGFGFGLLPKVIVVTLVMFFPLVINTVDGLRTSDTDTVRLMQAMNANRWQMLWLLRIPSALPSIFSGLKVAITYSVIGAVLAEWIGASAGLGVYIARSLRAFRTDQVFVAIVATSLLTVGLFLVIMALERWLTPWNDGAKNT